MRFVGYDCMFVLFGFVSAFRQVASVHRVFFSLKLTCPTKKFSKDRSGNWVSLSWLISDCFRQLRAPNFKLAEQNLL